MLGIENTFWLKQMQLAQRQLNLGNSANASRYYEKSFTEALWLLRYHWSHNCSQEVLLQLLAMCKKSLQAYEQLNDDSQSSAVLLRELEMQHRGVGHCKSRLNDEQTNWAFKALLATTAKLWARPIQQPLGLDSTA